MSRLLAIAAFLLISVMVATLLVKQRREGFEQYRTYTDDYYGVPLDHASTSGIGSSGWVNDVFTCMSDAECPGGMKCGPDGFCGTPCVDTSDCSESKCINGWCVPDKCYQGTYMNENGMCVPSCASDADCGPGGTCNEQGQCDCANVCPQGKARGDGCECICPVGSECAHGPDGEDQTEGDQTEGDQTEGDQTEGDQTDDPEGIPTDGPNGPVEPSPMDNPDQSLCRTWPEPSSSALIQGNVFRMYESTLPCLSQKAWELPMINRYDINGAIRKCAESGNCDGVTFCDSSRTATGFVFREKGGKQNNKSWYSSGNATALKEGNGSCGPAGKPASFGTCKRLSEVSSYMREATTGGAEYMDHSLCNGIVVPFASTGLKDFNFPDPNTKEVMVLRKNSDAILCQQLCRQDINCDAVELTEDTCRMYRLRQGMHPELRPAQGTKTMFPRYDPSHGMTRGQVLKEMSDPADHSIDRDNKITGRIPNLFVRLWCQRDDNEAYVEVLLNDGLMPGQEYVLTLEGSTYKNPYQVRLGWRDTRVKNVRVDRSADQQNGYVPVNSISNIRFTALMPAHLHESIWLSDMAHRRAVYYNRSPRLKPRGTYASFKNNVLKLMSNEPHKPSDIAFGQIIVYGDIATKENTDMMPSAKEVLNALQLAGVYVRRSGAMYMWEQVSDSKPVASKGDGKTIINDLVFPSLGGDSTIVVYMGKIASDLVPVARVVTKSKLDAPLIPPSPLGYDAWFATASALVKQTGASDGPNTVYDCAMKCDAERGSGNSATCSAFSIDPQGRCNFYDITEADWYWSKDTVGLVYKKDGVQLDAKTVNDAIKNSLTSRLPEGISPKYNNYFDASHINSNHLVSFMANNKLALQSSIYLKPLSNATLSNATLSNATLSNATLSNATLSNATLSNATLSNATLSNATLSNANDNLMTSASYRCELSPAGTWFTRQGNFQTYFLKVGNKFADVTNDSIFSTADVYNVVDSVKEAYQFMLVKVDGYTDTVDNIEGVRTVIWNPFFMKGLIHNDAEERVQWSDMRLPDGSDAASVWSAYIRTPFTTIYNKHLTESHKNEINVKGCINSYTSNNNTEVNSDGDACQKDNQRKFSMEKMGNGKHRIRALKGKGKFVCRRDNKPNDYDIDTSNNGDDRECHWSLKNVGDGFYTFQDYQGRYLYNKSLDSSSGLVTDTDGNSDRAKWRLENGVPM